MKLTAIALGMLLACAPVMSARGLLTPLAHSKAKAPAEVESMVLIEEDFEKMSAGTEDTPDATNIADKRTGVISGEYTVIPGWSGAAIYQAGGTCAILKGLFSDGQGGSVEETGFLRTPQGAYAGNLSLIFMARLLGSDKTSDIMDIALLNSNGRLESKTIEVTPQWQSFEVQFSKGEFSGCLLQMTMLSEEVLIDDLTVSTKQTSIPAPLATEATNYVIGGFTANWEPSPAADRYLLTVYEKKVGESVTIADFDDLNILSGSHKLDKTDPGFPEGWTFAYGLVRNADHVSDDGYNGSTGVYFRATGEGFITPTFDSDILDFSFWASHPSGQPCISHLVVSVLIDGGWQALGNYDIERIPQEGRIINLSSNLPEGVRAIQVYFRKNEQNDAGKDVSIVVDHVRIMVDPEREAVQTDIETTGYSHDVSGLDPYKDYSYTVKSVNADFSSSESNEVSAYGLAAPVTTGATEIKADGYTANWEFLPKADGYVVSNYRVYTTDTDGEGVTLLYENFDKVTEGTLDNPKGLYNVVNPLPLDDYTITPGWLGLTTYLVNGMLGTRSYFDVVGGIQTPALDLSGNGGNFTVKLKIVGDTDAVDEYVIVQAGAEFYIAMPIEAGAMVEREYDFDCGQSNMPLLIYSEKGLPFYVDEITVTQTLPSGTKVFYPVEERTIDDGNTLSTRFEGLKAGKNECFAYRVFAYRDFVGPRQYSYSDGAIIVDLNQSGVEEIDAETADGLATYYRIDGIRLPGQPTDPGIYIRRNASGKAETVIIGR